MRTSFVRISFLTRRTACFTLALLLCAWSCQGQFPPDLWSGMDSILARIKPPVLPEKDFSVTEYGAKGDGAVDCSDAFAEAIEACSKAGGGRVVVPEGEFLTGPIVLKNGVNLHLSKGSTVKFLRDPKKYLPPVFTRWEGVECMNYSPLIYAYAQENIAVTGEGTLDGQADDSTWWFWKGARDHGWTEGKPSQLEGRTRLFEMAEKGVPARERVFGEGFYLRPSFVQPYRCRNILIEGIRIINSPMWELHPVLCENVTVENVFIKTHGPNNDGCNPESSRDVVIRNCHFDTGDDCIAIKSGRNNDGRAVNVPSENIVIQKCVFKDGHGGITIGSEMSGSVRNVFAEDCEMESPVLYSALRIKSNAVRGGTAEKIYLRNITVNLVGRSAVDIDLFYEEGEKGNFLPTIRTISIENMVVKSCKTALNLVGYENAPLRDIRLVNCDFKDVKDGYKIKNVEGLEMVNTTLNGKQLRAE